MYLVDTMTVTKLGWRGLLRSPKFQQTCRVPNEILHELEGNRHHPLVGSLAYRMNIETLRALKQVMSTITVGDKVIDLYKNEGNGDAILIAIALFEAQEALAQLFPVSWAIVTDDVNLTTKARSFGITVKSTDELISELES